MITLFSNSGNMFSLILMLMNTHKKNAVSPLTKPTPHYIIIHFEPAAKTNSSQGWIVNHPIINCFLAAFHTYMVLGSQGAIPPTISGLLRLTGINKLKINFI